MGAKGYSAKITPAGNQKIRLCLYSRLSRIGKDDIFNFANGELGDDELISEPGVKRLRRLFHHHAC